MPTRAQVYQLIFNLVKTETGVATIKANQKSPRPARPYASVLFVDPSSRFGSSMDQQSMTPVTHTVSTEGMRKAVASINVFGENAIDILAKVRDALDRPDVIETFIEAAVAHVDESEIRDLTSLLETEYEERGQMDITVSYVASSEVYVGTIDEVKIGGTVNGHTVPTIDVKTS